jgi:hypothetical protein
MGLSSKDPAEKINITFDFSTYYTEVTNPVVTITLKGDSTDIPDMKATAPVIIDLTKVLLQIQGGETGTQYELRCTVDTDTGETVVAKDNLAVKRL